MTTRHDSPSPARRILKGVDGISLVLALVAALALVLLAGNIFFDVLGRWLFNQPIRGTLEATANWWMPTLTLLAFAYTERRQEHIKVTILLDGLPLRVRQYVEGVFSLIATALLIALAWHSLNHAIKSWGFGEITASSPPIVIWPFKFVAFAGVLALALQMGATSYRYFAGLLPAPRPHDTEADPA